MNKLRAVAVAMVLAVSACAPTTADARRSLGALERAHTAAVRLDMGNGVCSGTVIGARSILTATHCFKGSTELTVNGRAVAVMKRVDDGRDHTIIWVDRTYTNIAPLATAAATPGTPVRIWGNPAGMRDMLREGRMVGYDGDGVTEVRMELYDLNAFLGDSGSALFNDQGEVVGVLSGLLNLQEQSAYAKLAAALPMNFKPSDIETAVGAQ